VAGAVPLIIAHRGASGHRPEHTLAAYELAIEMGADYVEPDLVRTRDGVLVARHENEISATTDAAARFPERRTTKVVDGNPVTGWFVEDFSLAELRTLRAVERLPFRSHAYDGRYPVPTFEEVLDLVQRASRERGRPVGVYPELKHPSYFRALGLPLEEPLVAALDRRGLSTAESPVFVQSFEPGSLRRLRGMTGVRLVQLVDAEGAPYDDGGPEGARGYAAMVTPEGLRAVAAYADAVGLNKRLVVPSRPDGSLAAPTGTVAEAHRAGLLVHAWTLRRDSVFLAPEYEGDALAEWRQFAALGVDGMFGDFPDDGVRALHPARARR
jgi:glycerophosphoryl diester phosphodiesterase